MDPPTHSPPRVPFPDVSNPACLLAFQSTLLNPIPSWGISVARMLPSIFFLGWIQGRNATHDMLFCTTLNFSLQHATLCSVIYSVQILHFLIFKDKRQHLKEDSLEIVSFFLNWCSCLKKRKKEKRRRIPYYHISLDLCNNVETLKREMV